MNLTASSSLLSLDQSVGEWVFTSCCVHLKVDGSALQYRKQSQVGNKDRCTMYDLKTMRHTQRELVDSKLLKISSQSCNIVEHYITPQLNIAPFIM